MSRATDYLDKKLMLEGKEGVQNILDYISKKFKDDGYEVEIEKNKFHVTNKKDNSVTFTNKGKKFDATVEGYSQSIPLGDVGSNYPELKKIVDSINKAWMKKNDPDSDKW